ncbi:DUF927 domain-containing protein [Paraburkholderia sp. D1E]|uniref:DUF927 domain-containing protein n=1 Tax=Paraburkholderia sp. D1E TaxID=3461398 RepID=UPI004045A5C4
MLTGNSGDIKEAEANSSNGVNNLTPAQLVAQRERFFKQLGSRLPEGCDGRVGFRQKPNPGVGGFAMYPWSESKALDADTNLYTCIAACVRVKREKEGRKPWFEIDLKDGFRALLMVHFDDVGTGATAGANKAANAGKTQTTTVDALRAALGTPTFVLETSPDNFQVGYLLEAPCTDESYAAGAMKAIVGHFSAGGTVDELVSPVRIVRAPYSRNLKLHKIMEDGKHKRENNELLWGDLMYPGDDGKGFRVRLVEENWSALHTLEGLAARIGVEINPVHIVKRTGGKREIDTRNAYDDEAYKRVLAAMRADGDCYETSTDDYRGTCLVCGAGNCFRASGPESSQKYTYTAICYHKGGSCALGSKNDGESGWKLMLAESGIEEQMEEEVEKAAAWARNKVRQLRLSAVFAARTGWKFDAPKAGSEWERIASASRIVAARGHLASEPEAVPESNGGENVSKKTEAEHRADASDASLPEYKRLAAALRAKAAEHDYSGDSTQFKPEELVKAANEMEAFGEASDEERDGLIDFHIERYKRDGKAFRDWKKARKDEDATKPWGIEDSTKHIQMKGPVDSSKGILDLAARLYPDDERLKRFGASNEAGGAREVPGWLKELPEVEVPWVDEGEFGFTYSENDFRFKGEMTHRRAGVYAHKREVKRGVPVVASIRFLSPVEIIGRTRDAADTSWGRVLRLKKDTGEWKQIAVPMRMLAGDPVKLREMLLDNGAEVMRFESKALESYMLTAANSKKLPLLYCTDRVGWFEGQDAFVTPFEVIGANDVVFQDNRARLEYSQKGSLEEWKRTVPALAEGNPMLMMVMAIGLAGPLLREYNKDSVMYHLCGETTGGKTTSALAMLSIWGPPDSQKLTFVATPNAIMAAAIERSDTAIVVDEANEENAEHVFGMAYNIANGSEKGRSDITGRLREMRTFRIAAVTTGEKTIQYLVECTGKEYAAGMSVRLIDVFVRGEYGIFDDLHGELERHGGDGKAAGAAFAKRLKDAASKCHGWAGPEFVRSMLADRPDLAALLKENVSLLKVHARSAADLRTAESFAIVAVAGELGIRYGLFPWSSESMRDACITAFKRWMENRPKAGKSSDTHNAAQSLVDYIDRFGGSRFSDINGGDFGDGSDVRVIDRSGYWELVEGEVAGMEAEVDVVGLPPGKVGSMIANEVAGSGVKEAEPKRKVYYFNTAAWALVTGKYKQVIERMCAESGCIHERKGGRRVWSLTINTSKVSGRFYAVDVNKLRAYLS